MDLKDVGNKQNEVIQKLIDYNSIKWNYIRQKKFFMKAGRWSKKTIILRRKEFEENICFL